MYRSFSETQGSAKLYDYLSETKTPSTQFMIGYNIKQNPALFTRAFAELDLDIAIHTWSHRPMTTLSNLEIVAEFGWSMEIIKNSTVSVIWRFLITVLSLDALIPRAAGCRGTGDPHMVMPITA